MTTDRRFKNPLQQLVVERLEALSVSLREAAGHSGGLISHSTLARFARGTFVGRVRPDTVTGLARALEVAERVVWDAAEATSRPDAYVRLSNRFHTLSAEQQQEIIDRMRQMYAEVEAAERDRIARERPFG